MELDARSMEYNTRRTYHPRAAGNVILPVTLVLVEPGGWLPKAGCVWSYDSLPGWNCMLHHLGWDSAPQLGGPPSADV